MNLYYNFIIVSNTNWMLHICILHIVDYSSVCLKGQTAGTVVAYQHSFIARSMNKSSVDSVGKHLSFVQYFTKVQVV